LFIIFDEIYSGTNPVDAVDMAAKDLKKLLLDTYSNVIITTHFPDLAKITEIEENSMKLYYLIVEYNQNTNKFINKFVLSDDSRYGWWIQNRELRKLYNSYLEQVGFDARKLN
jgi:DNA mismatch repair ATPase MutS